MTEPGGQPDRPGGQVTAVFGSVTRNIRNALRAIPGVRPIETQLEAGQRFVGEKINERFEDPDPPRAAVPRSTSPAAAPAADSERAATELGSAIGETLRSLLTLSTRSTPAESRRFLYEALIGELLPDEARILSALSDGSTYAMVHIAEPGVGGRRKRVLENASSVGRAAGVALPEYVHLYVSHLRRIGLVESGPEDHSLKDEYDILLTDPKLRATMAATGKGPRGARVIRRTLRISNLGRELWEVARQSQDGADEQPDSRAK